MFLTRYMGIVESSHSKRGIEKFQDYDLWWAGNDVPVQTAFYWSGKDGQGSYIFVFAY